MHLHASSINWDNMEREKHVALSDEEVFEDAFPAFLARMPSSLQGKVLERHGKQCFACDCLCMLPA